MGYWFIKSEVEDNQYQKIGYEDVPEYLRIYAGDYFIQAFNNLGEAETDKSIAYVMASRIVHQRRKHNLTKKAVADKLGMRIGTYNAYEVAHVKINDGGGTLEHNFKRFGDGVAFRYPSVAMIIQLAQLFDCSVEWLIGVSDDEDAKFSDYNKIPEKRIADQKEPDIMPAPVKEEPKQTVDPLTKMFVDNLAKLSDVQKGILYGKMCEMLSDNEAS